MSAIQQAAIAQATTPGNSNYDPYYSNVSLLLAMNGSNNSTSFVDASPNQKTVTANGNAQISTTQFKFGGSSAYFDGTTDFLSVAASNTFNIFTSDFTVEFFVYFSGATNNQCLFQIGFNNVNRANIGLVSGAIQLFTTNNGVGGTQITATAPAINTWHHIAWVKSGTTTRLYVNGTSVGTPASSVSYPSGSMSVGIGADQINSGATCLLGYIDDLRITNGLARYTSNFTVPAYANPLTGPQYDPFYNNVSLLLHCNGSNASTNFIDNSGSPKTVTANGNAQISTAQFKFGGSSLLLDGTGDWVYAEPGSAPFGTADFTVEGWFYWTSITNGGLFHVYPGTPPGTVNGTAIGFDGTQFQIYTGGTSNPQGGSVSIGTWHHVAYVKSNGSVSLYVNGVKQGVSRADTTNYGGNGVNVGLYYSNGFTFPGYIDDFRVTIGVARYTTNFTPPKLAFANSGPNFDPYYDQVTLLLPFNGSNASTSFIDNSKTANIISVTGNTQISTAQSKFGGSSVYFDGTGDTLSCTASDLLLTADFTAEFWIYPSSVVYAELLKFGAESSGRYLLFLDAGNIKTNIFGSPSQPSYGTLSANTWTHLALVRSGSTIRVYINGVASGTTDTQSGTLGNTGLVVLGNALNGYIDDLRITKGVARYTSNFTVSVRPNPTTGIQYDNYYDNYYDNVSLLLHMNGSNNGTSFVDNSLRTKTVTVSGATITSTTQYKWGISSGYFNGGSSLNLPASDDFAFGLRDFTVECWVYISANQNGAIFSSNSVNNTGSFGIFFEATVFGLIVRIDGLGNDLTYVYSTFNQWVHLAAVRLNGVLTLYVNGTSVASGNRSTNNLTQDNFSVGMLQGFGYYLAGYLDDLRITKGIARYTANFTPPTQAFLDQGPLTDPFYYNTSLLLHFDGTNASTNFIDNSPVIKSITPSGNAQISTVQSKFGGSSVYLDNYSYLYTPNHSDFLFGSGDFTVESWVNPISATVDRWIVGFWSYTEPSFQSWALLHSGSNCLFYIQGTGAEDYVVLNAANSVTVATWTHVAVTRSGSTWKMFLNGVQAATNTYSGTLANVSNDLTIGVVHSSNDAFYGFIDDLRITKGVARYVNNFTPPQRPFPNQ